MSAPWKTVRVFISSTFRDMQAERDWLVRFVFPKLREELVKYRVHFVDVDLRWGVTGDEDAGEVCREVIGECRPRFLGLLGGRYGWVPPPKRIAPDVFGGVLSGQSKAGALAAVERQALLALYARAGSAEEFRLKEKPDTQEAREIYSAQCETALAALRRAGLATSITADEIDFGVLNPPPNEHGPVRAFFYFRKDRATARMVEERPGDFREPDGSDSAQKLAALKQSVTAAGLPVFIYDAQWDAAQKRLTGLEAFGNQVHADLLQSLKVDPELAARFTGEGTAQPDEFAEEAEQMEAFIEERTAQYITGSREPLLRDMLAFAAADGTPNIFVLTGDPGSGKSAFLAKFARELPSGLSTLNPQLSTLLIPHFIGASTGSTDLRRTLRRLCHDIARASGNTEPLPLDIKGLITHFQKLLTAAGEKKRVILVFDALNQFDATDGAHWLNWLPRELPPGVRIVASVIAPADGQPGHQTLAILRTRPGTRMEKLEPLTEADTLAVIEGSLRRYAKRLSPEQLAELLAKPAGRLPLYVLTALEELRTLGTYEEITDRIRTLPGDARALFGWILTERLARDPGFRDREGRPCGAALVEKFAACLGVSRHGLSPAELTALLDAGDPLGNVAALLRLLRPYLMRRGELLDFYHGQFREAAGAAHLDTPEKQRVAHQSVATCLQAFADPHRDGQCRDANPHALSELPHHLTRAEAWPDLIATLENIFFLEAKATHGMAFDLAEDFAATVESLPEERNERERLRLLNEALRRDIHFIARHSQVYPQGLFQCLWNSCWWYDCPVAAQHYENGKGPLSNLAPEQKLSDLLERWRNEWEETNSGTSWLRSIRPPPMHVGGAQLAVLRGHEGPVTSVAFSPCGQLIVSGGLMDKTVRVWDAATGAEMTVLRGYEDESVGSVKFVTYSPCGRRILSLSWEAMCVWDAVSGERLAVLRRDCLGSFVVAVLPDGSRILKDSPDGTEVWDAVSGKKTAVSHGHASVAMPAAFSLDGKRVVSGCADTTVRVWDAETGAEMAVLRGHQTTVASVAFSANGRRIVSGSWDATARVWDVETGMELSVLRGHSEGVNSVVFSPDGSRILSGSADGTVRVWDAVSGEELAVRRGHDGRVLSVCYSSDGRRIASASWDGSIRLWDAESVAEMSMLHGCVPKPRSPTEEGRTVTIGSLEEYLAAVTDQTMIPALLFSPDGRRVATGSTDGIVRLWDAFTGVEVIAMTGHQGAVLSVAYSPNAAQIVSGSHDKTARIWDAQSGAEVRLLNGHDKRVESVSFSPDGQKIVTGGADKTVRVWDAATGTCLVQLIGHEAVVKSVIFSTDGHSIISGSLDHTIRVWDYRLGMQLRVLHGHQNGVLNVSTSKDGRTIFSGALDETVRVWNSRNFETIAVIRQTRDAAGLAAWESDRLNFLLKALMLDTLLVQIPSNHPVARFPLLLERIAPHPLGRIWAGGIGSHLVLLRLEGSEATSIPNPPQHPCREVSIEEIRESARFNFGKGYWEVAAMDFQKLLARGEPTQELTPKIVTCLLNAHEDLMPQDAATIEDLLSRLERAGHTTLAADLRRQLEAKRPKPKRRWWKLWR